MTDDAATAWLDDLDPFDLLDREAARIEAHYRSLPAEGWERPSRCEGWSSKDVLAHMRASEDYHRACLDGRVQDMFAEMAARGATDLHAANAIGVADHGDRPNEELLADWAAVDAETRRRFRERGDGAVDTSIGDYPNRLQAFHVALELATHADDVGVPEAHDERADRVAWRAAVSRFALAESKPDVKVSVDGGRNRVEGDGASAEVDDAVLVEAVAGRLSPGEAGLSEEERALLSAMP
jgi:uncharacterized protein (TIGR03083 family)